MPACFRASSIYSVNTATLPESANETPPVWIRQSGPFPWQPACPPVWCSRLREVVKKCGRGQAHPRRLRAEGQAPGPARAGRGPGVPRAPGGLGALRAVHAGGARARADPGTCGNPALHERTGELYPLPVRRTIRTAPGCEAERERRLAGAIGRPHARNRSLPPGQGVPRSAGLHGQERSRGLRRGRRPGRGVAGDRRAEGRLLTGAGLPGDRSAACDRQRLPRGSPVPPPYRPQERCAGAVLPPRARTPHGPARARPARGGAARPCRVPPAPAPGRARTTAAGVPAPGGRSQPGWLQPAQGHDRLPAGCPALCLVPECQRSDESRHRGPARSVSPGPAS